MPLHTIYEYIHFKHLLLHNNTFQSWKRYGPWSKKGLRKVSKSSRTSVSVFKIKRENSEPFIENINANFCVTIILCLY